MNKSGVVFQDNTAYGIGTRVLVTNQSKAQTLNEAKLAKIDDPYVRMSARLQAAFRLRREEAIKFSSGYAFRGNNLLGHKSERITTHYSAPDIARLLEAAEKVRERRPNTVLRVAAHTILTQSLTQKDSGRLRDVQAIDV